MKKQQGLTLIEVLITSVILVIVFALAVPVFMQSIKKSQLSVAAESISSLFHQMQLEASTSNKEIFISFDQDTPKWCFGADDQASCSCLIENDCQVNGFETVIESAEFHPSIVINLSNYTHKDKKTVQVSGMSHLFMHRGNINLNMNEQKLMLMVTPYGIQSCSSNTGVVNGC
ncbi:prepilin-type N-terminal cleavage/methylation domain-containing protein [Thiotrichales bacterium 19S11-10]|nr:prepilin-type N-terminal cleavage/methylation domain-containing protein [Thiotrichales bacterium 19S11-10]